MKHGHKKGKGKATAPGKKTKAAARNKGGEDRSKTAGAKVASVRGSAKNDGVAFNNPTVGAAFKRAVKKFSNAFRRLTD